MGGGNESEFNRLRDIFTKMIWTSVNDAPYQDIGQLPNEWTEYSKLGDKYRGHNFDFQGDEIKVATYFGPKGMKFPYHREYQDEIFIMLGKARVTIPGHKPYIIETGETGFIKKDHPHKFEMLEDSYIIIVWADVEKIKEKA